MVAAVSQRALYPPEHRPAVAAQQLPQAGASAGSASATAAANATTTSTSCAPRHTPALLIIRDWVGAPTGCIQVIEVNAWHCHSHRSNASQGQLQLWWSATAIYGSSSAVDGAEAMRVDDAECRSSY